jgi:hypothetical protein
VIAPVIHDADSAIFLRCHDLYVLAFGCQQAIALGTMDVDCDN